MEVQSGRQAEDSAPRENLDVTAAASVNEIASSSSGENNRTQSPMRTANGSSSSKPITDLPADERALFDLVPSDGSAVTNLSLIKRLGWKEEKYWRVRDRLLDTNTLIRGRGRGGSVRRRVTDAVQASVPGRGVRVSVPELAPYPPLLKVLQTERAREMRIEPHQIHFEETAKQGKKATGGTWTRPDITAVSVRSFQGRSL